MEKLTAASPEAQSADLVAANIEQQLKCFSSLSSFFILTEKKNYLVISLETENIFLRQ